MKDITDLLSAVSKDTSASFEKVNAIQLNFLNTLMHNQQKLMQDVQADMAETFSMLKEESTPEKAHALQQKALTACAVRAMEAYKENIAAIGTLQSDWTSLNMDNLYAISQFNRARTTEKPTPAAPEKPAEAAAKPEPKPEMQASLAIESEPPTADEKPAVTPAKKKTAAKKTAARKASSVRKTVAKKS